MGSDVINELNKVIGEYLNVLGEELEEIRLKYVDQEHGNMVGLEDTPMAMLQEEGMNFLISMISSAVATSIQADGTAMMSVSLAPDSISAFGIIARYGVEIGLLVGVAVQAGDFDDVFAKAKAFLAEHQEQMDVAQKEFAANMEATIAGMMNEGGNGGQVLH